MNKLTALINEVEQTCGHDCHSSASKIHGIEHSRNVAYLAGRLAKLENVCVRTAVIGGFLHDCARKDNRAGNVHAHESADLARSIILRYWPDVDTDKVCYAIYCHADGLTTNDRLSGCIWDADRITLTRLGIIPDTELLSTDVARRFCNLYVKNNPLLLEIKKTASLIIDQINRCGEFFIGIWWGDASKWFLERILILIEKPLGSNLLKLKIVSLYDYYGLPQTHDQSTCYKLYKVLRQFASFSPDQIICPLHNRINAAIFERITYCVFSLEPPISPCLEKNKKSSLDDFGIFEIDPVTRDVHSRFFERYSKTPRFIEAVSLGMLNKCSRKNILFNNRSRRQFRDIFDYKNKLQVLREELLGDVALFYV